MIQFQQAIDKATRAIFQFARAYFHFTRSGRRWVMMAPNGLNKKERDREKRRLKGRRCRRRKGGYPTRGRRRK